jgi:hypothetical protein
MLTKIYHQIELKFWQIIIPQLSPARPLGKLLRKANKVKLTFPALKYSILALSGSILGTLGGVLLFSIVK